MEPLSVGETVSYEAVGVRNPLLRLPLDMSQVTSPCGLDGFIYKVPTLAHHQIHRLHMSDVDRSGPLAARGQAPFHQDPPINRIHH